jgi:hypothetical protein
LMLIRNWIRRHPQLHRRMRALRSDVQRIQRVARQEVATRLQRRREVRAWRRDGRPIPAPPAVKQRIVREYGRAFGLETLVETGTYLGEMVDAQRRRFRQIWSIELSPELHRAAQEHFARARNVTLLEGDSGVLISSIVAGLEAPALFWLDAHYSEGNTARGSVYTPIKRELEVILRSPFEHVILVDDARSFGSGDYPSLDEVRALVAAIRPRWTMSVATDVIRIHPLLPSGIRNTPRI